MHHDRLVEMEPLETLYRAHERKVRVFVRRRVGDLAVTDDVVSDTFLAAADALDREPDAVLALGWLLTVARRRIADHWRHDARRQQLRERLICETPADRDIAEDGDERRCVQRSLASLPWRQHDALALRYLLGATVAGVASHVGCSYQGAESLLARGRRGFARSYATGGV